MPRLNRREDRAVRARQRYAHPRLEDSVTAGDSAKAFVVDRAIERVGQRTHQERSRGGREHRVGVEGDDVADLSDWLEVAHDHRECIAALSKHETIELGE